jgi:hypothetical protein
VFLIMELRSRHTLVEGIAAASLDIGGESTPLSGNLTHRFTEPGVVRPERFGHSLACLCVRSAFFG